MSIRWITPRLGTGPALAVADLPGITILDVRDLVDKAGNSTEIVRAKIEQGRSLVAAGERVVVCCDYGISRSNSLAAGILALLEGIPFEAAVRRVQAITQEDEIKLEPLAAVRAALEPQSLPRASRAPCRLLLTGGAGFIGQAARQRLARDFCLLAPSRSELDLEKGGTAIDLTVGENSLEGVVHLANPRVYTSNTALGKSLTMLSNLLDVCVTRGIPLVYLSCWEVYSGYRGCLLADESLPALPRGPYGETKFLAEAMIEHRRRTSGLECALLRSSPVYGGAGDRPKFIFNFLDKIRRGETIRTHRYNNGDPALDLLHVDDLVEALAAVLKNGFRGNLNLGTGVLTSTPRIAELLQEILGRRVPLESSRIEAAAANIAMDIRQARARLDWSPTIPLEAGLRRLVTKHSPNPKAPIHE